MHSANQAYRGAVPVLVGCCVASFVDGDYTERDTAAPAIDFVGGVPYVDVVQWREYDGSAVARVVFRERPDCGRDEEEVDGVD